MILEVARLHHEYDAQHVAIAELTFGVDVGQVVSIVGPSGCGKTTLLKAIAGLLPFTSGRVQLMGSDIHEASRDLAMVFQEYQRSLFPWMRVGENVALPLKYRAVTAAERVSRVEESLIAVGLAGLADRYPWQLSGGMQQRVAIARALAYRPKILLMDEPFASVDAQTRADLEDLVRAVRAQFGVTMLLVTHDIDEAVYLADRVVVLSASPCTILREIVVELPVLRDQIATKALPEFVTLRSEVARLIRRP
ncbi:MAG TPA: ABC transporter ATP-binding protein [Candidatus Lustribacter sp.]